MLTGFAPLRLSMGGIVSAEAHAVLGWCLIAPEIGVALYYCQFEGAHCLRAAIFSSLFEEARVHLLALVSLFLHDLLEVFRGGSDGARGLQVPEKAYGLTKFSEGVT